MWVLSLGEKKKKTDGGVSSHRFQWKGRCESKWGREPGGNCRVWEGPLVPAQKKWVKTGLCRKFSVSQLTGENNSYIRCIANIFQSKKRTKYCLLSEVCPFCRPLDIRIIFIKPETSEIQLLNLDCILSPRTSCPLPGGTVESTWTY